MWETLRLLKKHYALGPKAKGDGRSRGEKRRLQKLFSKNMMDLFVEGAERRLPGSLLLARRHRKRHQT